MTRKMFTISEFAEHSNMTYKAAYTLVKKGGFHLQRSGHKFLIPANEVYSYMTKLKKLNKMLTVDEAAERIRITVHLYAFLSLLLHERDGRIYRKRKRFTDNNRFRNRSA